MLYHRSSGAGEPVVLVHGLFGSLENLGALARFLAKSYQVYSVDLPNHGRSPHTVGADLGVMAEQLREWMASVGLNSAHFVGHSLGGKVAMELALSDPSRVRRLVVMDIAPVAYPPRHDNVFAGLLAIDLASIGERARADQVLGEYVHEPEVRSFLLKNLVKAEAGFKWRMNLADLHDQYPSLISGNRSGTFSREVLFLKGADSDYIMPSFKEEVIQRFPRAELRVVDHTAHWLHAEKPELVSKLIFKFLAK